MTKYTKAYCKVCEKETDFVASVSPKGDWVCTGCHFKTDFRNTKLVQDQFGYHFKE